MTTRTILICLLISGCAAAPISNTAIPPDALARCVSLSEQHSIAGRALSRGAAEAAKGAVIGAAFEAITDASKILGGATITLPVVLAGYIVTAAINGAIEAQDRRDAIVRECLRDSGLLAY